MSGVDLTKIDGIDINTALKIIAEISIDMNPGNRPSILLLG